MTNLPPYPAYRDSGVPWLGEVPAHWESTRAKWLFRKMQRDVRPQDEVVTCFRDGTVTLRKNRRVSGFTESLQEIGYQGVRKGDLVIHAMDAFAGAVGVSDSDGKSSPVYAVCHPLADANPYYFAHVVREMARSQWILALAKGIRERSTDFRFDGFAGQVVPLPPPAEQAAIVRYLDHMERRIRRYIRAKRRLLALLGEQKQAIIHQAVTRGLDPAAPLKASGVAWLGEVPAHWEKTRLKSVAKIQTGLTLGKGYSTDDLEERPYLRVANVQSGYLDLATITMIRLPRKDAESCELQPGDVLMTEGGDIDKLGRGYIWRGEIPGCLHQNHVFAVRADKARLLPEFLVAAMTSRHGRNYFQLTAKQTTNLASTNTTTLKAFPLLLPTIEEQQFILQQLASETSVLDTAIAKTNREIDLLREYRTRLIADVVTGQVDVRAAAAALPVEIDDADEPLADGDAEAEGLGEDATNDGEVDEE